MVWFWFVFWGVVGVVAVVVVVVVVVQEERLGRDTYSWNWRMSWKGSSSRMRRSCCEASRTAPLALGGGGWPIVNAREYASSSSSRKVESSGWEFPLETDCGLDSAQPMGRWRSGF